MAAPSSTNTAVSEAPRDVTVATSADLPDVLEVIQRLEPVVKSHPEKLHQLLEHDGADDPSPSEIEQVLKTANLPEDTMHDVSVLAEAAERARMLEQEAKAFLEQVRAATKSAKSKGKQT